MGRRVRNTDTLVGKDSSQDMLGRTQRLQRFNESD